MDYEEAEGAIEEEYDRSFGIPSDDELHKLNVWDNAQTLRQDAIEGLELDDGIEATEAQMAESASMQLECNGRCDYALVLDNWDIYAKICKEQDWIIPVEPEEEREERICYAWN